MAFRVPFSASPVPPPYKFGTSTLTDSNRSESSGALRRAGTELATKPDNGSAAASSRRTGVPASPTRSTSSNPSTASLLKSSSSPSVTTRDSSIAGLFSSTVPASAIPVVPGRRERIEKGLTASVARAAPQRHSRNSTPASYGSSGRLPYAPLSTESFIRAKQTANHILTGAPPTAGSHLSDTKALAASGGASGKHSIRSVVEKQGYLFNQNISELCKDTGFSRRELYRVFATFKALCSLSQKATGVDKETLRCCIPLLGVEDPEFVNRVFSVLDFDGSGEIEWDEFLEAMSAMEKGTREKRAEFLFRVYDTNEDGNLSEEEFCKFFVTGMGSVQYEPYALEVSKYFVRKLFEDMGAGGASSVTVKAVLKYLARHPEIQDVYGLFGRSFPEVYDEKPNEDPTTIVTPVASAAPSRNPSPVGSPLPSRAASPGNFTGGRSPAAYSTLYSVAGGKPASSSRRPRSMNGAGTSSLLSSDPLSSSDFDAMDGPLEAMLARLRSQPPSRRGSKSYAPPGLSVATSGMKADPDYVYHDPEPSELAAALWSEVERRAEEKYKARQLLPAPKSTSTSTEDAMDMPELASLRELVESMSRGEF